MFLHNEDKELFGDMIRYASEITNIREDIIEKDYYVTMILKELAKIEYPIVFKEELHFLKPMVSLIDSQKI